MSVHARTRRSVAVALSLVLAGTAAATLPPAPAGAAGPTVCTGVTAPTVSSVASDTTLNTMFTNYGNSGNGWTGADSTWSAQLPDGRDLFMFSDTFLEPITPPTRPTSAALINNSFVPDNGGTLSTIQGGTSSSPLAVIRPATSGHWFWLGSGTVLGGILQVPVTEWERTGTGAFDIAWVGNSLAKFSLSNLGTPSSITALPSSAGIEWGSWVRHDTSYTYIYGVEDLGANKYLHIARVSGTDLAGTWSYYVGGDPTLAASWSSTESASVRVLDGVANEYSVHKLTSGLYMLTTMDTTAAFSAQLEAYFSCTPTGPFVDETLLYTTPESGPYGSYGNGNVYTYNAHVHVELSTSSKLVISYNVNSLDATVGGDVYRDVSIYRPRFIDVNLTY
jgi:hypothetical protein